MQTKNDLTREFRSKVNGYLTKLQIDKKNIEQGIDKLTYLSEIY